MSIAEEAYAAPYLRRGQHISLVKWSSSRDGWTYATVLADYVSRDERFWHVIVHGDDADMPREEWALFAY